MWYRNKRHRLTTCCLCVYLALVASLFADAREAPRTKARGVSAESSVANIAILPRRSPPTEAGPPSDKPRDVLAKEDEQSYSCVVHVHSKISGEHCYSLPELTEIARGYGVDAVFLTDNLTASIQYGLSPLRNILWVGKLFPSVMTVGPERYLEAIAWENARQSDVLYVPGVEVCPRFYWTGSLLKGDLVCHDHQRNLAVLGTRDADLLSRIPETCGYVWGRNPGWIIATRTLVGLFVAACVGMIFLPRALAKRSEYSEKQIRRSFLPGLVLPLAVVIAAVNIAASHVPAFQIYGGSASRCYEQRVIDFLKQQDLVHYWMHPEAYDHSEHEYFGVRFSVDTRPYPDVLLNTSGFTGFAGIYEDRNTLIEPGSVWDQALWEYADGARKDPAWCFGEMLYHYEGQAGKKLGNVETVIWAGEKSESALLASLRKGLFYSRRNTDDQRLVLDEWSVGGARSGETLTASSNDVEIVLGISAANPEKEAPVQVIIIRNGEQIREMTGTTPFEVRFRDAVSGKSYYRALVRGSQPLRLATNPIFVVRDNGSDSRRTDNERVTP